jgi:hypothetical protein
MEAAMLVIGLGPGFVAGENCHAVVETQRGHTLGRVIWHGSASADTGIPEAVDRYRGERVLRAPADGPLEARAEIGQRIESRAGSCRGGWQASGGTIQRRLARAGLPGCHGTVRNEDR